MSYDRSLFDFFIRTLDQKLKSLDRDEHFSNLLKRMLMSDFKGRIPPVEIAASTLNMTARTLQRKLKDEHTTYRKWQQ